MGDPLEAEVNVLILFIGKNNSDISMVVYWTLPESQNRVINLNPWTKSIRQKLNNQRIIPLIFPFELKHRRVLIWSFLNLQCLYLIL